jgi:hypothetical protein
MAAGVMALILSSNPNLSYHDARVILETNCEKVGDYTYNSNVSGQPNGTWSTNLGYGRINAYHAVLDASNSNPIDECIEINQEFVDIDCSNGTFINVALQNDGSAVLGGLSVFYTIQSLEGGNVIASGFGETFSGDSFINLSPGVSAGFFWEPPQSSIDNMCGSYQVCYSIVTNNNCSFFDCYPILGSVECGCDNLAPEIVVNDITIIPSSPVVGESVEICVEYTNIGLGDANDVDIEIISVNGSDIMSSIDGPNLDPGESTTECISYTFNTEGWFEVCATVEEFSLEENTENNILCQTLEIGSLPCIQPTGLVSSNVTTNSASLSWQEVPDAVNYYIERRICNTSQWLALGTSSSPSLFWSSAECGTCYQWRVQTICSNGSSSFGISSFNTLTCGCIGVEGCMNPFACNYNSNADCDDGSCVFGKCIGCTDFTACNYDPNAIISNNSICLFPGEFCDDEDPLTIGDSFDEDCNCIGLSISNECLVPTSAFLIENDPTWMIVGWIASPDALGFQTRIRSGFGPWVYDNGYTVNTEGEIFNYYFNLECSETYEFQVRTLCDFNGNYSDWSMSYYFYSAASADAVELIWPDHNAIIESFAYDNNGNLVDAVEFTIDESPSDIEYQVQINSINNFNNPSHNAITPYFNFIWWNFPNDGNDYFWRVRRNTCVGWSDWSDVFRFVMSSSVNVNDIQFNSFRVYPNPCVGLLNVTNKNDEANLYMYDSMGRLVLSQPIGIGETSIDVSYLSSSLYILVIMNNETVLHEFRIQILNK